MLQDCVEHGVEVNLVAPSSMRVSCVQRLWCKREAWDVYKHIGLFGCYCPGRRLFRAQAVVLSTG